MTIAVTGGNGEFGQAVLEYLGQHAPGPLVATVRDLASVRPLPGVEYRPGDFDRPETLRDSLAGVDTVLVNATFFGADPSLRSPRVGAAIRAAARAGVHRIVLTSWPDLGNATMPAVQDYAHLEDLVTTAGPAWTVLRLGYGLADALARDVVWGRAGGEIVAPARAACVSPAAVTDLAEAAAIVLLTGHDGAVHELTGPDPVTWDDLAELAGAPFRAVTDDEYRDHVARLGLPAGTAQQLLELYADFRGEWDSAPTPTLMRILGRPAVPGVEAVRRRVALFPTG
jgi:NAD(P)H dehydrogenase (quinone)